MARPRSFAWCRLLCSSKSWRWPRSRSMIPTYRWCSLHSNQFDVPTSTSQTRASISWSPYEAFMVFRWMFVSQCLSHYHTFFVEWEWSVSNLPSINGWMPTHSPYPFHIHSFSVRIGVRHCGENPAKSLGNCWGHLPSHKHWEKNDQDQNSSQGRAEQGGGWFQSAHHQQET